MAWGAVPYPLPLDFSLPLFCVKVYAKLLFSIYYSLFIENVWKPIRLKNLHAA